MRMTTMSMPSAARGAESGETTSGVRVGRLTVVRVCRQLLRMSSFKTKSEDLLPFRALVPILSEAMTAKRSLHLIALGLLLPR